MTLTTALLLLVGGLGLTALLIVARKLGLL